MNESMKLQLAMCPLCDMTYDTEDKEANAVHQHFEPQSGPLREAWISTRLPWSQFEGMIREHIAWIDIRRLDNHKTALGTKSNA